MATAPRIPEPEPQTQPRYCDLVMKGGITSGIVYPKAVCELAKRFSFRNIGGTSAGAIAAAATAAAELGRHRGRNSFDKLATLPELLGQPGPSGKGSFLFTLFQPQRGFERVFRVLTSLLGASNPMVSAPLHLARSYWLATVLCLLAGAGFWLALMPGASGLLLVPRVFAVLVLTVLVFLLGVFVLVWRDLGGMSGKMLGLCTGMPNAKAGGEALTPWLGSLLNDYAGNAPGEPLTFGDLWGSRDPQAPKQINLEMMTTCLTHGRPYRLPLDQRIFYFREEEFRQLFPGEVVDWMVAHPRQTKSHFDGFVPMPETADLPVIVATRMSLSFPVLFTAVPLYAVDHSRPREQRGPEVCWFSDGGICSNFPVHFFDSPLPRWPTFAINLMDADPARFGGEPDDDEMLYLPSRNTGGILELWNRFGSDASGNPKGGLAPVMGMLAAIMKSMQNWVDSRQMRIPGYRERIVHVSLLPNEGGMNLQMPAEVIAAVSNRGGAAGKLLATRFAPESEHPMNWDNHRWVRFRSTMTALEELFAKLVTGYTDTRTAEPFRSYEQLLLRGAEEAPDSFRFTRAQRDYASIAIPEILALARQWSAASRLGVGAPRPEPELRMMPRFGVKFQEED